MSHRQSALSVFSLVVSTTIAGIGLTPIVYAAPESTAGTVSGDSVEQPYAGLLNTDNVYVRSGPSDAFYATMKLNKGVRLTVAAVRSDWLKIIPPDGSYCYVAKTHIEKRGDGTEGRVMVAELNVRAGSSLNGLKTTVQTSLAEGDMVKIVGEEAEFYKIAPPPGAYLYIKKMFVDAAPPVAPAAVVAAAKQSDQIAIAPTPPVAVAPQPVASTPVPPPLAAAVAPAPVAPIAAAVSPAPAVAPLVSVTPTPTTQPTVAVAPSTQPAVAMAPAATQPVELSADAKFDEAESAFLDASSLPLDQQPVDALLAKYTTLASDSALPSSMQRIATRRVETLKLRSGARNDLIATQKMQADAVARRTALKAENDELIQRVKDQSVSIYTALGTLRISSLQQSGATMYRLTDPETGRTLMYLRSNDAKYAGMLNQFIGVKGDIAQDSNMNLKVITPVSAEAVDQSKVNTTITATVIPPSLLPRTATASFNSN